ncbi:MAG: stalk domain-containing protein [Bacillota bacterium]
MRRMITLFLILALLVVGSLPVQAAGGHGGILVDGRALRFDVEPQVIDGVLMIPIRAVAEAMQGKVTWDPQTRSATVASGNRTVVFTVGKSTALLDGRPMMLSGEVAMVGGRTFVPASFLLIFYGGRLDIDHPAVRDPRAIDLLLKSVQYAPALYDLELQQAMHMSDGVMTIDLTAESTAQVRGEQMLMQTSMKSLMLPPGAGDIMIAIKAGKQYIKAEGVWQEVPGEASVSALEQQFSLTGNAQDLNLLSELILEAHLGESRVVNGDTLQDVVVTYDLNRLLTMFGQLLPAGTTGDQLSFERYTAVITIDRSSYLAVAQQVDLAMVGTVDGRPVRLELQMAARATPNPAPLVWPEELK